MLEKVNELVHRTGHIALDPSTSDDQTFKSAEGGSISDFSPSISSHLGQIYKSLTASKADFFQNVQHDNLVGNGPSSDTDKANPLASLDTFRAYMASPVSSAMRPAKLLDTSATLTDYFISSSHNTYLTGNQLYSDAAASSYTNALLSGCRCVEIDVWNGQDPENPSAYDSSSESSSDEEDDKPKKAKKKHSRLETVTKLEGRLESKLEGKVNGLLRRKTSPDVSSSPGTGGSATAGTETQTPAHPEPMVLHGHTLTKATTFREVCFAIRDSAFVASDLPVIISLEVHANLEQQQMMVDIMEEAWKGLLVDIPPDVEEVKELPPLERLKRKILIKAKWSPPTGAEQIGEDLGNYIEEHQPLEKQQSADASSTLSSKTSPTPSKKPSKTLHALSRLAVYTKGFHFSDFDQPEAKKPEHVFSLSENAAKSAHTRDHEALFEHNKKFFMRIYPGGVRVDSSNYDPTFFWRTGAQIVALNWQSLDKGMMLNHGMFAGEKGWVLKPEGYKSTDLRPTAVVDRKFDLSIQVFAGQGLSLPPGHTKEKSFHPYVSCSLHVEQPDEDTVPKGDDSTDAEKSSYKRTIKYSTGVNPDFGGQTLEFPTVSGIDEELSFVRFKVKDDAIGRDATASWACIKLDRLQQGYRFIHLYDTVGQKSGGALLVRIVKDIR